MIDYLTKISQLSFPLAIFEKPRIVKETANTLVLGPDTIIKQQGLYETFNIHVKEVPKSFMVINFVGNFFQKDVPFNKRMIITDNLSIYFPCKCLKVEHYVAKIRRYSSHYKAIQIEDVPYIIPIGSEKMEPYALIAKVEDLHFHVGWSEDLTYKDEFYI